MARCSDRREGGATARASAPWETVMVVLPSCSCPRTAKGLRTTPGQTKGRPRSQVTPSVVRAAGRPCDAWEGGMWVSAAQGRGPPGRRQAPRCSSMPAGAGRPTPEIREQSDAALPASWPRWSAGGPDPASVMPMPLPAQTISSAARRWSSGSARNRRHQHAHQQQAVDQQRS